MNYFKLTILLLSLCLAFAPLPAAAEKLSRQEQAVMLIDALGCKGCHRIKGDGGDLAPALDQIGSRMTRKQIRAQLRQHTQADAKGFMPSYATTSADDLKLISNFLYNLQ